MARVGPVKVGMMVRFRHGAMMGLLPELREALVTEVNGPPSNPSITVLCHGSADVVAARSDLSVMTTPVRGWVPIRYRLPYGMWTCADGREVLFNREYRSLWQRYPGRPCREADPDEWVPEIRETKFYVEGKAPWQCREARARCEEILRTWQVPDRRLPYPSETIGMMRSMIPPVPFEPTRPLP